MAAYPGLVCAVYSVRVSRAGRYVDWLWPIHGYGVFIAKPVMKDRVIHDRGAVYLGQMVKSLTAPQEGLHFVDLILLF